MECHIDFVLDDSEALIQRLQTAWVQCDDTGVAEMVISDTGQIGMPRSASLGQILHTPKIKRGISGTGEAPFEVDQRFEMPMSLDIALSPGRILRSNSRSEEKDENKPNVVRCKTVAYSERKKQVEELSKEEIAKAEELAFAKRPVPAAIPPPPLAAGGEEGADATAAAARPVSALSALVSKSGGGGAAANPFADYMKFSGEGHQGAARTVRLKLYPDFGVSAGDREPLEVIVLGTATVEQVAGLALFKFKEEGRQYALASTVEAFCIRMVEDDGMPDMDFPALDKRQPICKFGFLELALCEMPNARKAAAASEEESKGEDLEESAANVFVKVYWQENAESNERFTTADTSLKEVLEKVLRRRHITSFGVHRFELRDQPGVEADLTKKLKDFKPARSKPIIYEFNIINTQSKRNDVADDATASPFDMPHALTSPQQYQSWVVHKKGGFNVTKQQFMLGVDGEKISIIPYGSSGIQIPGRSAKLATYDMSLVVQVLVLEEKSDKHIRFTSALQATPGSASVDFKNHDYVAESVEDAKEIVGKIQRILDSQHSEHLQTFTLRESSKRRKSNSKK